MCAPSNYHPYECSHDKYCEHCTLARTDWHTPENCALCDWSPEDHPDKGSLAKMVDENFAINIRVWDVSHRKQKVKVNFGTQEQLGFK